MYERFYNLRERPFALSPDPEYLYLSRVHREALDSIRYGVESRAGFIVVTGEIGAGKTTLIQTLIQRLDQRVVVARLVNTTLDPRELVEAIVLDFGMDTTGKSKPALLRDLGQFLVRQRNEGRRPLLVIDEAQNLTPAALEEIRLLSNLETDKSKLLQILLAGQPNLRDTIASPELEQFRQRVVVSYHLAPLDAAETTAYINSRLDHAAIGRPPQFPADAAALVHRRSRGIPRIINVICDAALVFGYAEERREIDVALIRDVVAELELTGILPSAAETEPAVSQAAEPATHMPSAPVAVVGAAEPHPTGRAAEAVLPSRGMEPAATSAVAASPVELQGSATIGATAETWARASGSGAAWTRESGKAPPSVQPAPVIGPAVQEHAMARAQEAAAAAAALAAREQAIVQRERELAEQRRILAEEYRLLRSQRMPAAAATPPAAVTSARMDLGHPRVAPYVARRREGPLGWLKRLVLGGSHRTVEEKLGHLTRS